MNQVLSINVTVTVTASPVTMVEQRSDTTQNVWYTGKNDVNPWMAGRRYRHATAQELLNYAGFPTKKTRKSARRTNSTKDQFFVGSSALANDEWMAEHGYRYATAQELLEYAGFPTKKTRKPARRTHRAEVLAWGAENGLRPMTHKEARAKKATKKTSR